MQMDENSGSLSRTTCQRLSALVRNLVVDPELAIPRPPACSREKQMSEQTRKLTLRSLNGHGCHASTPPR